MTNLNEKEMVSFCGLYCESCPMYTREISKTAEKLAQLTAVSGFEQMAEFVPEMAWYTDFKKRLEWFKNDVVCDQCRGENKGCHFHPDCELHQCCLEKKVDFCFNCPDYPCAVFEEFKNQAPYFEENLQKIREMGVEDYIKTQMIQDLPEDL